MPVQPAKFESPAIQESLFRYLLQEEPFQRFGMFVPAEAFTVEYLEVAWDSIRKFFKTYKELPAPEVLVSKLVGEARTEQRKELLQQTLENILNKPLRNKTYLEEQITAFLRRQELGKFVTELESNLAVNEAVNLLELRGELDRIAALGIPDLGEDSLFQGLDTRLSRYCSGEERKIPTGMGDIMLGRGELGVIMAPPKRGKSLTLVNVGYGALVHGYRVFHTSLELRKPDLDRRYDRAIGGLTKQALRNVDNHDRLRKVMHNIEKLKGDVVTKYFAPNRWGTEDLYAVLSYYQSQGQAFDAVIVDYADLMRSSKSYKDRRFELSNIYTDLRAIAGDFGIALWTATQSIRATLTAEIITMADVAEDIGKMAIADFIVAFCQTIEERKSVPERARFFIAGGREEQDGRIHPLLVDRDTSKIKVLDNECC